jgi:spermidine synthase
MLASHDEYELPRTLPAGLRFLSPRNVGEMFVFPNDMLPVAAEPNRLNSQVLVHYYERDWKDIVH